MGYNCSWNNISNIFSFIWPVHLNKTHNEKENRKKKKHLHPLQLSLPICVSSCLVLLPSLTNTCHLNLWSNTDHHCNRYFSLTWSKFVFYNYPRKKVPFIYNYYLLWTYAKEPATWLVSRAQVAPRSWVQLPGEQIILWGQTFAGEFFFC